MNLQLRNFKKNYLKSDEFFLILFELHWIIFSLKKKSILKTIVYFDKLWTELKTENQYYWVFWRIVVEEDSSSPPKLLLSPMKYI